MKKNIRIKFLIIILIFLLFLTLGTISTNAETRNNDPMLKAIKINGEDIEPKFDMFTTEYVIIVDDNVEEINIEAIPDDENAQVQGIGNKQLKTGRNEFEIKVTAEDEISKQSYYIYITRGKTNNSNANLESLKIGEYELAPAFEKNTINYAIEYPENLEELEIIAKPEDDNAKVEIIGNKNLKNKHQNIEIKVTAGDKQTIKTYYVIAKKAGIENEEDYEVEKNGNNNFDTTNAREENYSNTNKTIILLVTISVLTISIIIIKNLRRKS